MSIGDVFAKAWELWRRDIGWLILAGLVVGLIVGVVAVIVFAIVAGMLAASVGGIALGTYRDTNGITGLGVGTLIGALILGVVGYLIVSVLATVFYGGLFEMVIGAARENRGVDFGDLFGGFRKFGSFIVFWLVIAGISIVCGIVALIPIIGIIAVLVFGAWLGTTWLYVLPLIADRGLTFGEAARTSSQMVKGVGWWKTFGTVIVFGAAFFVIALVISAIGRASSALSSLLLLIFEIAAGPFAICYISTMYLGSGGAEALAAPVMPGMPMPGAGTYAMPVAPPYPPAVSGPATPAIAAPLPPPTSAPAPPPGGPVDASAWKAAADPLAAQPPSPAAAEPHLHHASVAAESPAVDGASGQLEKHCSQCGAVIGGSEDFCQACALEMSGGEPAAAAPPAGETPEPASLETPPAAPEAPKPPEAPKT
jgi:Membrane domain of glycerophosphoryl diester phosphodiesterase